MDEPVWCLKIAFEGGTVNEVHGTHDALLPAFQAFHSGDYSQQKVLVEGICNSADRAPLHVAIKLESVMSMALYRDQ